MLASLRILLPLGLIYGSAATVVDPTEWTIARDYVTRVAGCSLTARLWLQAIAHGACTFDLRDGIGGNNGGLQFEGDRMENIGLRDTIAFFNQQKSKYGVTFSDSLAFAGILAVKACNGPDIPYKPGRLDTATSANPINRLPNIHIGGDEMIKTFNDRYGFNMHETVALMGGGHSIAYYGSNRTAGRLEGFSDSTPQVFDNQFFIEGFANLNNRTLPFLTIDRNLLEHPQLGIISRSFAADNELFFQHFAGVYNRLIDLGSTYVQSMQTVAPSPLPSAINQFLMDAQLAPLQRTIKVTIVTHTICSSWWGGCTTTNTIVPDPSSVCANNQFLSGSVCKNCSNLEVSTGTYCVCDGTSILNPLGQCELCGINEVKINGTACACKSNHARDGSNTCIQCTGPQQAIVNGKCTCTGDHILVNGQCMACDANEVAINNQCVCNQNSILLEGQCLQCGENEIKSNETTCQCRSGYGYVDDTCIACTGPGLYPHQGQCVSCYGPNHLVDDQGECTCTGNAILASAGVCQLCPDNSIAEQGRCLCNGQEIDPGFQCSNDPDTSYVKKAESGSTKETKDSPNQDDGVSQVAWIVPIVLASVAGVVGALILGRNFRRRREALMAVKKHSVVCTQLQFENNHVYELRDRDSIFDAKDGVLANPKYFGAAGIQQTIPVLRSVQPDGRLSNASSLSSQLNMTPLMMQKAARPSHSMSMPGSPVGSLVHTGKTGPLQSTAHSFSSLGSSLYSQSPLLSGSPPNMSSYLSRSLNSFDTLNAGKQESNRLSGKSFQSATRPASHGSDDAV